MNIKVLRIRAKTQASGQLFIKLSSLNVDAKNKVSAREDKICKQIFSDVGNCESNLQHERTVI